MFLKFKKTCVFHGDRSAGEIVEFDVPPRDVSIVIGAGLAEYVDGPGKRELPENAPNLDALESTDAASAEIEVEETPMKKPATRKTKKK